jgi:hypothetical protein
MKKNFLGFSRLWGKNNNQNSLWSPLFTRSLSLSRAHTRDKKKMLRRARLARRIFLSSSSSSNNNSNRCCVKCCCYSFDNGNRRIFAASFSSSSSSYSATTTTKSSDEDESTSSSSSIPPHPAEFLLNQPLKLYRDCLRLADYLAFKQSVPRFALREQVRQVWRKNQFLIDANEIRAAREAALRGLSNSMMHFATENLDVSNSNQRAFLEDDDDEGEEEEKK